MNITDIKVRRLFEDNKLKALISITIDNAFAVHDIKVINGSERLFVAMPSRKDESGAFRDVAHPITAEARTELEEAILNVYLEAAENEKYKTPETPEVIETEEEAHSDSLELL